MKTKIIAFVGTALLSFGLTFAGDLAGFVVSVNPSTVKVGEPADLTVKAVDSNGDVVTDYQGDIIITVTDKNGNDLDVTDYVAPQDGTYEFTEEDQGVKTFTKGLIINKPGEFYVKVEDFDTGKSGKALIKVVSSTAQLTSGKIKLLTPQNGETIESDSVTVAGQAKNYKNSKLEVYVDGKPVAEGLVDVNGSFNVQVSGLTPGKHKLKVNILDINNKVVASSDEITINVKKTQSLFKNIEILPSGKVIEGTQVIVNVNVDPSVNSAVLELSGYGNYPMDRVNTTKFSTTFVANKIGKFPVSVKLSNGTLSKDYKNVATLTVKEKPVPPAIKEVKVKRDNHKNIITLSWTYQGKVPQFKVLYGNQADQYIGSGLTSSTGYVISNIDNGKVYFIKIEPVDQNGNLIGSPSKEIVSKPNLHKAATCMVDNIKVNIVKMKGHSYLVWKKVPGAVKYLIFKGDTKDNLQKIDSTTGTSYLLPYNPKAKKIEYAYFAVKAVCDDGTIEQIDKVKKVTVGPMDWLIYAIILTMIVYGIRLAIVNE